MTSQDSNSMNFINSDHDSMVCQKLFEQKKSDRFCDITLYVNAKVFRAHRIVLACSSPFFDSILKYHRVQLEQLTVSCLSPDVFDMILTFMYTGEITIDHTTVEQMLMLADHFIITKVIEYCIDFLGAKLNLNNCLFTFFLTQRYKLKHLSSIVENWIVGHLDEICVGNEIGDLTTNQLYTFFKTPTFRLSTSQAVSVLAEWVLRNIDEREKYFLPLLCHSFDVDTWEPSEVFKHLDNNILYNKSELCLYRFLHVLLKHNWMLSHFKVRYDELHEKFGSCEIPSMDNSVSSTSLTNLDEKGNENKISVNDKQVTDLSNNALREITVRKKLKSRKQMILRRLMFFGLKPSLRMAALKLITDEKGIEDLIPSSTKIDQDDSDSDSTTENEVDDLKQPLVDGGNTIDKSAVCPICSTTISDSALLEQHLSLSHGRDITYKCGTCGFICQIHGEYLNHMKSHFNGPPFKCDFCEWKSGAIAELLSHRVIHLDQPSLQCTLCTFKCRDRQSYLSHYKVHACDSPNSSVSSTSSLSVSSSITSHDCSTLYDCLQCSKAFNTKHQLETHTQSHATSTSPSTTSVCSNVVGSTEKNLSCDTCGFHTRIISHMVAHKRVHAVTDPYRCSYAHCNYTAGKKSQMLAHESKCHHSSGTMPSGSTFTQTNSSNLTAGICNGGTPHNMNQGVSSSVQSNTTRPHTCLVCGRRFMEKSHLVRHERIHLEEKPFKCSNCDYASSRRDKLKEHFNRHHGEHASAKVPYKARPLRNPATQTLSPKRGTKSTSGGNITENHPNGSSNTSASNISYMTNGNPDLQELLLGNSMVNQHFHPNPSINQVNTFNNAAATSFSDMTHGTVDFHQLNTANTAHQNHHTMSLNSVVGHHLHNTANFGATTSHSSTSTVTAPISAHTNHTQTGINTNTMSNTNMHHMASHLVRGIQSLNNSPAHQGNCTTTSAAAAAVAALMLDSRFQQQHGMSLASYHSSGRSNSSTNTIINGIANETNTSSHSTLNGDVTNNGVSVAPPQLNIPSTATMTSGGMHQHHHGINASIGPSHDYSGVSLPACLNMF